PAPYAGPQQGGGQPSPYGQQAAPQVPAAAPAPQGRWLEHPLNQAYEYLEGTQQYRLKGQG
ncbi:MAG: hypothetical protein HC882_06260, partial [Acidobacteria bacterium]|nr:hypothetical protein [Acidobacteriota bacterium]